METSIIVAGFGGQGVLFAGQLLAYAGMEDGRNVTWIPSYGPEMRGGTAHCTVIISHDAIGAPIVAQPDMAIALNPLDLDSLIGRGYSFESIGQKDKAIADYRTVLKFDPSNKNAKNGLKRLGAR